MNNAYKVIALSLCCLVGCGQPESLQERKDSMNSSVLLGSKTPYQPQQAWQDYSYAPAGFDAVMVQHVARHGSRVLSSPGDDDLAYQLWLAAKQANALTDMGETLGPVLQQLIAVHKDIGYGSLSELGRQEHRDMAARMLQRHPALFEQAIQKNQRIAVLHSGRVRAAQSAEAFLENWSAVKPALVALAEPMRADQQTLYFNKAEGSEGYNDYRDNDPRLKRILDGLMADESTQQTARALLERLFSADFLDRIDAGELRFQLDYDDDTIASSVDAAMVMYSLLSITSNMPTEGDWQFERFVPEPYALWFAELDDADSFYGRGPGFSGEDITYRLAGNLVTDMLNRIEHSTDEVAAVRFTHAQVLMPLAAFLGIKNASEGLPETTIFSYQNSSWRSALVSPMSANVQWGVYRNAEGVTLIHSLHHEKETQLKSACQPYPGTRYFYQLTELKRCLLPFNE